MKLSSIKYLVAAGFIAMASMSLTSCVNDLDVENENPQQVADPNLDAVFNKIYANMSLTGQQGPAGSGDIANFDEGFSNFVRIVWNANEITTDEAHCWWNDPGIPEFNHNAWTAEHNWMQGLYYRLLFGVTLANFYLDNTEGESDAETLQKRAEARFMRAFYYFYLCDLYGNPPMVTHISSDNPVQATRKEVYDFIEKEFKDIVGEGEGSEFLANPRSTHYGRADKAAAWLMLSRLYLNAEVYTGTPQWQKAKDYADKVLNSGYSLHTTGNANFSAFQMLFMGDNDSNGAQNEIILPVLCDGNDAQSYGGTLFIIASTTNADIREHYPTGTTEQWGGNRARKQFSDLFFSDFEAPSSTNPHETAIIAGDDRALFYTEGHTLSIDDENTFDTGYAYVKFLNTYSTQPDGTGTHNTAFTDTDFPILRLAEAYLNYAEADARINGGTCTAAGVEKIKALRARAHANVNISSVNLDQLIDEWGKEFGFEGRRRMDLIRFGMYGGQSKYKWEWMGGTYAGTPFSANYNIFAIPNSDLNANSNLRQNPGY
ncbi:MAG: RagB/SusD family nutrient uptake outer membrane protein [Muribaculaceae bacterium]|nr:RagB/SusD family nutrient uptake outer membrane protein [Muribaculaceae bacterium]